MAAVQRYVYLSAGGTGGKDAITLDHLSNQFQVTINVDIVSGATTYGLEFTTDDMSGNPANFRWLTDSDFPNGQTAGKIYKITSPITGVRLNLASITGETRIAVVQNPGRGV